MSEAVRFSLSGASDPAALRDRAVSVGRALSLGGWARADADGVLRVHAEGRREEIQALMADLAAAGGSAPAPAAAKVEGHEQFAARGVIAGEFVVQEHAATAHHFDLRLQVGEWMRSWAVPRGPSLDPAEKRLAIAVEDHQPAHNRFEGALGGGAVIVWDRGGYEQGGRVPWPAAVERGHAVFVLHGEKLRGGFALQRTGAGPRARWLLVKRRDAEARPGSDVVAEQPRSVLSGRTLGELLADPRRAAGSPEEPPPPSLA